MNASIVPSMVVSLFLLFTILGFILGWFRGLSKSLTRLIMVLAVGVLTFFVVPEITKSILEMDVSRMNLTIGDIQVMTVQDLVTDLLRQIPIVEDIIEASPTFETVIEILPRAIVNVLLFVVLFFVFKWMTMIIYWIIAGVCFSKKKMAGKDKHNFIGAVLGAVQGLIIVFVIMVPFYGVVNIINPIANALDKEQNGVQIEQTFTMDAQYVAAGSGETTKKENSITATVDTLTKYVDNFENVWINKVLGFVGVNKLGARMFEELTTVESKQTELSIIKEVNVISEAYPYLNPIINDGLDIQDNDQIEGLKNAINELYASPILSNIVKEIVPEVAYRWSNGYDFCGIKKPKVDDASMQSLIDVVLLKLSVAQGDTIKTDIDTTLDIIMIANDANLIKTISENGDIMDVLSAPGNETLISDIIGKALESTTLKAVLPEIVDVGMGFVYDALDIDKEDVGDIDVDSDEVNWNEETPRLQTIFTNVIEIYDQIQEGTEEGGSALEYLDFKLLGETFDNIRISQLLGPTAIPIMDALLKSEEIVGSDKTILAPFIDQIKSVCDPNKPFEPLAPTFETIGKTLKLAKDMQNNDGSFNPDDIGDILTDLATNGSLKGVVNEVVNTDTLQNMGLNKETADMVDDTISSVINADYSAESGNDLAKEIEAAKEVYDIANKVINNDSSDPESKVEISAEASESLVSSLADSTVLLNKISEEGSGVENLKISENLTEESQNNIKNQIDSLNTETLEGKTQEEIDEIKNKLNSLFGF